MKINNENQARQSIEEWRELSTKAQLFHLRQAIEDQEMSQMYYEQKGNEKGILRVKKILEILQQRQTVLEVECKGKE